MIESLTTIFTPSVSVRLVRAATVKAGAIAVTPGVPRHVRRAIVFNTVGAMVVDPECFSSILPPKIAQLRQVRQLG
jgi:hypothetical protein